jgi:hypothetical protein
MTGGPDADDLPPLTLLLCLNDTPENARWACTVRCLTSLGITADLQRHALWIVDNGSTCPNTACFLTVWCADQRRGGARLRRFRLPHNRHATYAFNRLLAMVPPAHGVIRIENDIEFHSGGWPSHLAGFLARSGFGMACPMPADLPSPTEQVAVSEVAGTRVRIVDGVAGYCTAMSPALRQQLGALVCAGVYIEDVFTSRRARLLGHRMAYLHPEELRCYHVDRSLGAAYAQWKAQAVAAELPRMRQALRDWETGRRPLQAPFTFSADDGFHEVAI